MIASRQLDTSNVQLTRQADGHGPELAIEDINLGIGDGAADGHGIQRGIALAGPIGHVHCGFGRPVQIVQFRIQHREEPPLQFQREGFTAADHALQAGARCRQAILRDEQLQHRRHEMERGDFFPGDELREIAGIAMTTGFRHDEP